MSTIGAMPAAPAPTPAASDASEQRISSPLRLFSTFYAPGRTFEDIARAPHFILCWVVQALVASGTFLYEVRRMGVMTMAQQMLMQNAAGRALAPEQARQQVLALAKGIKIGVYVGPVTTVVVALVYAAIFLAAANFIFGKEARFKQAVAMVSHALLPLTLFWLIALVVLRFTDPANFYFSNPVGSNPAFFLDPATTSPGLYSLCSHLDLFAFWCVVLLSIGLTKIGRGIKFRSAFSLTFGLWILCVLALAGLATI